MSGTKSRPAPVYLNRAMFLAVALVCFVDAASAAQNYTVRGLVLKVDKPNRSLVVSCERIPNVMNAMVMPFTVRSASELDGLDAGTMIQFTLVVDGESSYITAIRIQKYESVEADPLGARRLSLMEEVANPSSAPAQLKTGDAVPDFSLIDQNSQRVALSQFKGKIVVMTFMYTHCVLPNFCFRTANNFRLLQKRFADQLGSNLIFISITFDPEHDTPAALAQYGKTWNADPKSWKLLTGPQAEIDKVSGQFGVTYFADMGLITHSLHTVIITRDGTLAANLEGNEFNADQLGDLVQTVLAGARNPSTASAAQ
ncbi:MAG: SCO family protein [Candidatus Acidiferrales bacterium]